MVDLKPNPLVDVDTTPEIHDLADERSSGVVSLLRRRFLSNGGNANIALDEAQIWSEPWQPATDLRDYRTQFAAPVGASWEVQATGTGLALVLRF